MKSVLRVFLFLVPVLFLTSCGKGYEVRFTNYYIEPMDSVIIGNKLVVFQNIPIETTTEFNKLQKGTHYIRFITKTKKNFISKIVIPNSGTGKRTIQIDGITQVSILEE